MSGNDYALGHADIEMRRLELRGAYLAASIERVLLSAGLGSGMSVLDIGTGAGDVALLAARIVGPTGSVLGIDPAVSALDRARDRTIRARLSHIHYEAVTLESLPAERKFDAVVSSHVIGHVPDPVAFLRTSAAHVRSGGILAHFEVALPRPELPSLRTNYRWSTPPVPLFDQVADLCMATFALAKSRSDDGYRFVRLFREAGLPEPEMSWEEYPCSSGGPIVESLYLTFIALLPAMKKYGLEIAAELDADDLLDRMRTAVEGAHSQLKFDNLVSGWVRTG